MTKKIEPTTKQDNGTIMRDPFNRKINYMRISLTDRCNLRCIYCMPEEGLPWLPKREILSYEEITSVVRGAALAGVRRIRLSGGEPLVRRDVPTLVAQLKAIEGIEDISLSTNGILLPKYAEALAEAGLNRVNVSLDTLNQERFQKLARRDNLAEVLAGLSAAEAAGLNPLKINMVVMRGYNDDELAAIAALSLEHEWHIRFIEVMPVEENIELATDAYMSADEILQRLRDEVAELIPTEGPPGNGPARYYRFPQGKGTVGVISPMSHNYCNLCNRVRLTADGQLRLCLFGDQMIDIRTPLREGATTEQIASLFRGGMLIKPERHYLDVGKTASTMRAFSQIGG